MRFAFTIVLNGLHHLKHNDYYLRVLDMVDMWAVAEGACNNTGSTQWCNPMPEEYHHNGRSIDGTIEFLMDLESQNNNIVVVQSTGLWKNKDSMVNAAVSKLPNNGTNHLWQIDVDEQWTKDKMKRAESILDYMGADCAEFFCNYEMGNGYRAIGSWGEGKGLPYRRLWKWKGQEFESHEPPVLSGGNGHTVLLPQRFNHYAYYFEKDVVFKDKWYGGHSGIYGGWKKIQSAKGNDFKGNEILPDGMALYRDGTTFSKTSHIRKW